MKTLLVILWVSFSVYVYAPGKDKMNYVIEPPPKWLVQLNHYNKFIRMVWLDELITELKSTETWHDSLNYKYGNPYKKVNSIGAMGAWQFMPKTLRWLGYKDVTFIRFLNSKELQKLYMLELVFYNMNVLQKKSPTYKLTPYDFIGTTIDNIEITLTGLIGASHLAGVGGVQRFLAGRGNASDGNHSVKSYLQKFKNMNINPKTKEAYELFMKGILALARAEQQGIRVDMPYVEHKKAFLTKKIDRLEDKFRETGFYKEWKSSTKGELNINSSVQLQNFLYKIKKYEPPKYTKTSTEENPKGSTDVEALHQLNIPELNLLLERDKLVRLRDVNLDGFAREQVDGYIHPFFNLHLVRTFRSCVAKGTLVLMFLKSPKEIPIEEIKEGDLVYCFNDDLNLAIRKVLWAGKTGHREVIRIHYFVTEKEKGYLDVTPEHLIRLIDGTYEKAQNLNRDYGKSQESDKLPKTLSCSWIEDKLKPGNHSVTKIEWIKKIVDVYDIEVEEYNNFFANEICVHNSANSPNFQNIPIHDEESAKICRGALYPRPGHQLMEIDYSGIEFRIMACYNKDKVMLKYIHDPKSDPHGDISKLIFKMEDIFDKKIPSHNVLRQASKNSFIFPELYGSYYKNCASNMCMKWLDLPKGRWKSGMGIELSSFPEPYFLSDYLISKGIKFFDSFVNHLEKVEDDFRDKFEDHWKWMDLWYNRYLKNGYVDSYTGFRYGGVMKLENLINAPVQGSAFHCLLWSFIELDRIAQEEKWDSKLIGQIHDSIVIDVCPNELSHVAKVAKRVTCVDLPKAWSWITVPLDIEIGLSPIDGSWALKEKYKIS